MYVCYTLTHAHYVHNILFLYITVGSDFSPPQLSLQFSHSSTSQIKCGHFFIIRDGLDEDVEYFNLTLKSNHGQFTKKSILVRVNSCRENGKKCTLSQNVCSEKIMVVSSQTLIYGRLMVDLAELSTALATIGLHSVILTGQ